MPCANSCYKQLACSSAKKLDKKETIENVFLSTGDERVMYNQYVHPYNLYTLDEDRERWLLIESKKLSKRIRSYQKDQLQATAYRVGSQLLHHIACINNPNYIYPVKQMDEWGYSLVDNEVFRKLQWDQYFTSDAIDTIVEQMSEILPHHLHNKSDFKTFMSAIISLETNKTIELDQYYSILPEATYLGVKILITTPNFEKLSNSNLKEFLNEYKKFATTFLGMWRLQKLGAQLICAIIKAYVASLHVADPSVYGVSKDGRLNLRKKELLPLFKEMCKKLNINVKLKTLVQCLQTHYDESFNHGPKFERGLSISGIRQQYALGKHASLIGEDIEKEASWMAILLSKCDVLDTWVKDMNAEGNRFKGAYLPRWKFV